MESASHSPGCSNVQDILRPIQSRRPRACHRMNAAYDPLGEGGRASLLDTPLTQHHPPPLAPPRRISWAEKHGAGTFPDADGGHLPASGSSRHLVSPAGRQRPWLPRSQSNAPSFLSCRLKTNGSPQFASHSPASPRSESATAVRARRDKG